MFLTGLALLPAIALVVWIYRQDKVEKEPGGLLWKIFLFGVFSVIPAMILEIILDEVFLVFMDADTLCYVILDNFIGVALIEELCKMQAAQIRILMACLVKGGFKRKLFRGDFLSENDRNTV